MTDNPAPLTSEEIDALKAAANSRLDLDDDDYDRYVDVQPELALRIVADEIAGLKADLAKERLIYVNETCRVCAKLEAERDELAAEVDRLKDELLKIGERL
jgi:hypothetical protein